MKKIFFLFLLTIGISFQSLAQIHICEEILPMEDDTVARGMLYKSKLWENGKTIKVKFLDGSSYLRRRVMNIASVWSTYANIKFETTWSDDADIRVSFKEGSGSWSYVGTDCRRMANLKKVTMNYGWLTDKSTDDELRRVVLHEFGHALGLTHEHLNPLKNFTWNETAVKRHYLMRGWTLDRINRNMLKKYSKELSNGEYDPNSIMHYAVPNTFTVEDVEIEWNRNLSASDKKLIAELYPDDFSKQNKPDKLKKYKPLITTSCNISEVNTTVYNSNGVSEKISFDVKFNIKGAASKLAGVRILLYDENGNPLESDNIFYKSKAGQLSVYRSFLVSNSNNYYGKTTLNLPVSVLSKSTSASKIKYKVKLYISNVEYCNTQLFPVTIKMKGTRLKSLVGSSTSSKQTSTIEFTSLKLKTEFDAENKRFKMIPQFTVKQAKGKNLKACIYFYDSNAKILRSTEGSAQSWCKTFVPYLDNAFYYSGALLTVYVPYNEINMPMGKHALKYFVAIWEGGKQIATSKWSTISMTRN